MDLILDLVPRFHLLVEPTTIVVVVGVDGAAAVGAVEDIDSVAADAAGCDVGAGVVVAVEVVGDEDAKLSLVVPSGTAGR